MNESFGLYKYSIGLTNEGARPIYCFWLLLKLWENSKISKNIKISRNHKFDVQVSIVGLTKASKFSGTWSSLEYFCQSYRLALSRSVRKSVGAQVCLRALPLMVTRVGPFCPLNSQLGPIVQYQPKSMRATCSMKTHFAFSLVKDAIVGTSIGNSSWPVLFGASSMLYNIWPLLCQALAPSCLLRSTCFIPTPIDPHVDNNRLGLPAWIFWICMS